MSLVFKKSYKDPAQRHRGRQDHMDKPLLFSITLMKWRGMEP